jgi:diguanylate cyclase (GGDEF)-like protein
MVVVVSRVIPEFWMTSVMCVVAVGIWAGLGAGRRAVLLLVAPSLSALVILGVVYDPVVWMQHMVAAVALTILTWQVTDGVRNQIAENEAVLERSLSTSSSFVHMGDVSSGHSEIVFGPIEAVTGWTKEQWLQVDMRSLIHPDDADEFWLEPEDLHPGFTVERQARFRTADNGWVWLRDNSHVLRGVDGGLYLRGFAVDVTAIEAAHEVIRVQAREDALTGLPNRTQYIEELHRSLETEQSVAVIVMDIDRFKAINDTLGHAFGDDVLIEVAKRLQKQVRESDVVARLSGDEFAIIYAGTSSSNELTQRAKNIAAALSRPMNIGGMTLSRSVSIGIAFRSATNEDAATLLRHADIAMYEAKQRQQTVRVFSGDIQRTPLEELTLSASLHDALDDGQFILHYQPKVDLRTGAVTGFEGLARWNHPALGLLTPDRFIELLAFSDEGQEFADHVIETGVRFARTCADAGFALPVAVNISALSLFDEGLPERVAGVLQRHQIDPEQLIVEITEADIMEEVSHSSRVLQRLADMGLKISIDDFGTGYSSLARLADLPINEIKIDRRFVSGALSREQDRIIVRSIVDLATNLNLNVIAEGVESRGEVDLLVEIGCHEAQGYLFSKPVDEQTARQMLGSVFDVHTTGSEPADEAEHAA